MPSPLFWVVLALLALIGVLLLVVIRVLEWHDDRQAEGAYRMSSARRRQLMRERYDLNPALRGIGRAELGADDPTRWRMP